MAVLDVLVVDDCELIRRMILKTLRMADVPLGATYEAGNGREALDILRDNWIDLVLADINMPVMDGLEMLRHMRDSEDLAQVPVIVVSTEGATSRMSELEGMGISAYLRKPFTPEKLRDVITGVTTDWTETEHDGLLSEIFQLVLDQFAFMYGEAVGKDTLSDPGDDLMVARMTFAGAQGGAMALAAPRRLCAEMAANVLGADSGVAAMALEEGADALGEALNIACGHVTSSLQADAGIDLSPPTVERLSRREWESMAAAAHTVAFLVEDQPMLLLLGLRG
jgi:two-component system, chemotaxis family, chemotaxis protein CheY